MPDIINFHDRALKSDFSRWVLLKSLANDKLKDIMDQPDFDVTKMEIELKVNGVEVSFQHAMDAMWDQWEEQVEEKAADLLRDKADDIRQTLIDINEVLEGARVRLLEVVDNAD